ncbi:dynamin-binding protein-like [Tropilaelaps mercedesae]|uniref:Dynamin-binding protein n=1 Tax=Tropilaelaps mercedesae TaxID=418985 RepID=A0A1V9X5C0_9ACAR|nr:dynamin-binding protein-like [Tropilaelaps mercedesae]
MQRTSNCFDLASVLIKPVQRILKYPLLINELEKATEDSHPDKQLLWQAMDDMARVAADINEVKRRKDLVSKYRSNPEASLSQRLAKLNLHSVMKKSTRLTVKMSSSLGFTTVVRDEDFEREEHRFVLVERSIKNFLKSMRMFCDQLQECLKIGLQLAEDICDFYAECCSLPEVDRFRMTQHAVYAEYWAEFTKAVDKQVVETLQSALEMLAAPHKIIAKREHKLLDLAACTARTEKNRDATRHKAFEEEEQSARNTYNALNSQLLDELPQLCNLSSELLCSCVHAFLRARKLLIGRIANQLLELSEHSGLQTSSSEVLDIFEQKHRAALQAFGTYSMLQANLSGNLFKMDSFAKGSNFLRKSFNDKHGTALDLVPQTDSQRQWVKQEYSDNVYTVALTIQTNDPDEISLNKGDLVGLIRSADSSGNPMRWFVDNGRCKGLIASKHLLRDVHHRMNSGAHATSSSGFIHSTGASTMTTAGPGPASAPRTSSYSSTTNRAAPVRPTSLTSNGISASTALPVATAAAVAISAGIVASTAPVIHTKSTIKHQTGLIALRTTAATTETTATILTTISNPGTTVTGGNGGANNNSATTAGATNSVKIFSNGNALYGNIESPFSLSGIAPNRASVGTLSLQQQNERTAQTLAAVNDEGVKVLPSYPSQLTLQPSKRVVNPVISSLPNRSNQSGRSSNDGFTADTPIPHSLLLTCGSQTTGGRQLHKPLPALPADEKDNLYSNLDAFDNCDMSQHQQQQLQQPKHDPRSLIDVRQRLEEYYYALYKLDQVGPGQLPLLQGQVVLVIFTCDLENNPEWWFVEDRYGKQGYVPASYLRKYKTP